MSRGKELLSRTQLPVFFLLATLFSWWPAFFTDGRILPYGPAIAAAVVMAMTAGRRGLGDYWRHITKWRSAWYWYARGPAIILGYQGAVLAIMLLAGASMSTPLQTPSLASLLGLILLGGQWEEPGWSGYALPRLKENFRQRQHGILIAILILGIFRALWHLPLFLYGHIPWFDLLAFEIAFQVIIAWIYLGSGGCVPAVMTFHLTSNLAGAMMVPVFSGTEQMTYTALFMGLAILAAIGLAIFAIPTHRRERAQDEPASTPDRL